MDQSTFLALECRNGLSQVRDIPKLVQKLLPLGEDLLGLIEDWIHSLIEEPVKQVVSFERARRLKGIERVSCHCYLVTTLKTCGRGCNKPALHSRLSKIFLLVTTFCVYFPEFPLGQFTSHSKMKNRDSSHYGFLSFPPESQIKKTFGRYWSTFTGLSWDYRLASTT